MPTSHIQIKRSLSPRIYIIYILNLERNHHQWSTIRDPPGLPIRDPRFSIKTQSYSSETSDFYFQTQSFNWIHKIFFGDSSFFNGDPRLLIEHQRFSLEIQSFSSKDPKHLIGEPPFLQMFMGDSKLFIEVSKIWGPSQSLRLVRGLQ